MIVNANKFDTIMIEEFDDCRLHYGFAVRGYREDESCVTLSEYDSQEMAEQAINEIYVMLKDGITAMKMPVYNW